MRKIFLLTVLAAFVAAPATAAPKKPGDMTFDEAMAYNQKNLSLVVKGLPLILPSWATPIYFGLMNDEDKGKGRRKKR